jgi:nucleoporin GLE1
VRAAAREQETEKQAAALKQEADDVARRLAQLSVLQDKNEEENGIRWNDQQRRRQEQIESVIRSEVEKRRLEEERLAKEEAERLRKEAAKVAAEEQRKKEEAAKAAKEAEEAKAKADEEAVRKETERMEQAKAQAIEAQTMERNALGMTTPGEDWRDARLALKVRSLPSFDHHHSHNMPMQQLKSGPIARVKANRDSKKMWNEIRRMITPRVGQLTNEPRVIANIVSQLLPALPYSGL